MQPLKFPQDVKVIFILGLQYRYRKAQLALEKGDEDLAREALKRRKSYAVSLRVFEIVFAHGSLQDSRRAGWHESSCIFSLL